MDSQSHWQRVYQTKRPDEVSWYRPHLDVSLALIEGVAPDRDARIIDIGGGESTLVDDLLIRGYRHVSVLDVSSRALEVSRARLGDAARDVEWLCGDVRTLPFPEHRYDIWHDRAMFHFLVEREDRMAYVRQVLRSVKPGGHVIVATFASDGPMRCSGLDVVRYGPEVLLAEFGERFRSVKHVTESHRTPRGANQQFLYLQCTIKPAPGRVAEAHR